MELQFWGVRGGIPTPERNKLKYGGDTSCVSLKSSAGGLLILDAGTGIRSLGNLLLSQPAVEATILLSHLHWDHIQGIPFFRPLFLAQNSFTFIGAHRKGVSFRESLEMQQGSNFLPVDMKYMAATKTFREIGAETFNINGFRITSAELNHPGGCLGYRIEVDGLVITYTTDTEHYRNRLDHNILALARDADLFIYDSNYTPEEYANGHRNWGHSTWEEGVKLAKSAGVKRLIIFHHDQCHDDDFLEKEILAAARRKFPPSDLARQGAVYTGPTAPQLREPPV